MKNLVSHHSILTSDNLQILRNYEINVYEICNSSLSDINIYMNEISNFYSSFQLIWINVTLVSNCIRIANNTSAQNRTGRIRSCLEQQQKNYTCIFAHYSSIANSRICFRYQIMCKFVGSHFGYEFLLWFLKVYLYLKWRF